MDTLTNSQVIDGLIAGDFPVARDTVTLKLGQDLERGSVLGKEDGTSATKLATNDGTYKLTAGITMVMDTDNQGNETVTFDATAGSVTDDTTYTGGTAATIEDTTTYAVSDQVGLTAIVTQIDAVHGTTVTTVTFGTATSALHIAADIGDQTPYISADGSTGQVILTTDEVGADCSISVAAGTGGLTWDTAVAGTNGLADQDGLTEVFTIDGGTAQTVTFAGLTTEALDVAAQINDGLEDASAVVTGGQVVVTPDSQGSGSTIAIGTGTCGLSWATPVAPTGDVVSIDAVTVAEVKTRIEADTTGATVTAVGSAFRIDSDSVGITSELEFVSGSALAIFGLAVAVNVGTGGSGHSIIADKDGDDGSEEPQCVLAADCDASSAATVCPVYRTGTFDASKLIFASGTVAADLEESMAAKSMFHKTSR